MNSFCYFVLIISSSYLICVTNGASFIVNKRDSHGNHEPKKVDHITTTTTIAVNNNHLNHDTNMVVTNPSHSQSHSDSSEQQHHENEHASSSGEHGSGGGGHGDGGGGRPLLHPLINCNFICLHINLKVLKYLLIKLALIK